MLLTLFSLLQCVVRCGRSRIVHFDKIPFLFMSSLESIFRLVIVGKKSGVFIGKFLRSSEENIFNFCGELDIGSVD